MSNDTHTRREPMRRCIVTGEELPKAALLRFVVDPSDTVMVDLNGSLPGRGLWLSPGRDIIARAVAENAFSKAARRKVTVPEDLCDRVATLIRRRCLSLIGLAKKAGQLTGGFDQVKASLNSQKAGVVLAAHDGGDDGRRKIKALAGGDDAVRQFSSAELGAAVGREKMVHAIIAPGKFADRMADSTKLLAQVSAQG